MQTLQALHDDLLVMVFTHQRHDVDQRLQVRLLEICPQRAPEIGPNSPFRICFSYPLHTLL